METDRFKFLLKTKWIYKNNVNIAAQGADGM